jgi:hypothetical protein
MGSPPRPGSMLDAVWGDGAAHHLTSFVTSGTVIGLSRTQFPHPHSGWWAKLYEVIGRDTRNTVAITCPLQAECAATGSWVEGSRAPRAQAVAGTTGT